MKKAMKKGFTLIELMIVVAIIGLLAALAIPNFLKFQARAKTSEAKTNLKGLFTAQKSYLAEHDTYGADYDEVGFAPERGNRYSMWMGAGTTAVYRTTGGESSDAAPTLIEADTFKNGPICGSGGAEKCVSTTIATVVWITAGTEEAPADAPGGMGATLHSFSAFAYGDIDADTSIDIWYIANTSSSMAAAAAECIPQTNAAGGTPAQAFNDIDC